MNLSKTAIIMDSGCDLTPEIIEQYNIKVLNLKVMYSDGMYSDGKDIDPLMVYERFEKEVPKTSTPNPAEVLDLIDEVRAEGYENIIGITISSGLSGTFNAVRLAFMEVEDMKTFAFDTKNISIGAGLLAVLAAKKLEEGMGFAEVCDLLEQKIYDSKVFFYMDTLDYLKKGGRISPAVAIVGKVLNLKPIISCNEKGTYYTAGKLRGNARGIEKLISLVEDFAGDRKAMIAIMNGAAVEQAAGVKPIILGDLPNAELLLEKQITATMAIHTGPGLVGIGTLLL